MMHIGIDHHKKYSHIVALADDGKVVFDGRLDRARGQAASSPVLDTPLPKRQRASRAHGGRRLSAFAAAPATGLAGGGIDGDQ